jgi:hypothetical protein
MSRHDPHLSETAVSPERVQEMLDRAGIGRKPVRTPTWVVMVGFGPIIFWAGFMLGLAVAP